MCIIYLDIYRVARACTRGREGGREGLQPQAQPQAASCKQAPTEESEARNGTGHPVGRVFAHLGARQGQRIRLVATAVGLGWKEWLIWEQDIGRGPTLLGLELMANIG
jgi:hypothetical protein